LVLIAVTIVTFKELIPVLPSSALFLVFPPRPLRQRSYRRPPAG